MRKLLAGSFLAAALLTIPVLAQNSDTVRAAQQALKDKGMDPGPVDGVNGPLTRAAVRNYQKQQNLNADGRLGPKTLDTLGVKQGTGSEMKAGGEQVKNSYSKGGSDVATGTKDAGHELKHGQVADGATDFGKGVGHGAAKMGAGTGHAAKSVAKGVKNALTPAKDKNTAPPQ